MNIYDQFSFECKEAIAQYEGLHYAETMDGVPELSGTLFIRNGHEILDEYSVRIIPTADFPNQFPFVYETEGKIPNNIDWHVHEDGHFCLCTIPEEFLKCKRGINLSQFIENEVTPFLFNQTYRRNYGFFYQERRHGFSGELDYYAEILGLKSVLEVAQFFKFLIHQYEPGRTEKCFCKSGKKYRNCHRDIYRMFRQLSNAELQHLHFRIVYSGNFKNAY